MKLFWYQQLGIHIAEAKIRSHSLLNLIDQLKAILNREHLQISSK